MMETQGTGPAIPAADTRYAPSPAIQEVAALREAVLADNDLAGFMLRLA